ncbi:MAG TPA: ATP-dependent zinc metalloprotease FtsH [Planctomycetota bacterium]|nr:ATP-dependent zinc metalloprotease FtsH [Planctomycetota bacterium]
MADDPRKRPPRRPVEDEGASPPRRPRGLMVWLLLIGGVVLAVSLAPSRMGRGTRHEPSFDEVLETVRAGNVASLLVHGTTLYVTPREGGPQAGFPGEKFDITISPHVVEYLTKAVEEHNAKPENKDKRVTLSYGEPSLLLTNLLGMLPWILILGLLYYMFIRQLRSAGSGVLSFGRARARTANPEQTKITFDDVAGVDEAKEEVVEIIDFLRSPEKFRRLGGRVPRGVLLVGPPGSGKTLLAKAIAGEAGRPFFSISGSDFVEMFVGVGASRVRDLFKQAKEHAPCIIFLDEIDAVGRRRGTGLGGGHDEREQTLNAILVEMDGFDSNLGVILVAATNRPDVLDPALLRPGRFDRRIVVDLPDVKGREAILRVHARKVTLAAEVDLKLIARGTPYFSGADLENLLNEAALLAVRRNLDAVGMSELEEARDKVLWGPAKKSRVIAEEEKRLTAYHETGHAVVSKALPEVEPIHKVAIVARGMALGATMYLPTRDRYIVPRKRILAEITSLLGGRASEELFCDDITSGAQNDFERATELARMMVCRWGMSQNLGPISYTENEEHIFLGREITRVKSISDATAVAIDGEIRQIIDQCYAHAKELLSARREGVERVVAALLKYESIDGSEVDTLLAGGELHREENNGAIQAAEPQATDTSANGDA